ncbi:hypothetical protein [Mammaliicoccus lentus]|uniref:hypothetical protein n=1 Tax=Mammaliicoccus lentus TaxID=42858 RepID=UPI0010718824|nr:hypothetical protein [Mammaliicoccus lentus]MBF0749190.1 hypothetical protein [Mammaliicoccus lentus]TFU57868.1 hypothetical protein E4T93_07230 [Mammaliicoccus lentus]
MGKLNNEDRLKTFVEGYKEVVYKNYSYIEDHFNEAFPIIKFEKFLTSCYIKVDEDIFMNEGFLLIVDNFQFEKEEFDFTILNSEDHRSIMETDNDNKFKKLVSLKFNGLDKKNVFYLIAPVIDQLYLYNSRGKIEASSDYNSWKQENNTSLDQYNHDTISPYSHLDYDGLIQTFNSKKYNEDFSYQMNQAEECYKRKLYLPAAATLSVALETVLMAICEKENVNLKTKESTDTMMNYLGERLLQEKVINYRMHKRIDVTYSLRNSVSHSNPGEVSKADCQIILSCIKVLIDEHYSK